MIRYILTAAALAAAAPVVARDARLVTRAYNGDEVVRIEGHLGVQASVIFAEDEHIENVAIGDSTSWQITPNKRANMLFVKPLSARARTNMTVVTDRRTYLFDLHATATTSPLYVMRFTFPNEPVKPSTATALTLEETEVVNGDLAARAVDPAVLNFAWASRGSGKLLPSRIYDDGNATYLSWTAGISLPAILIRNDRGDEGPVNFAVRGDVIVIDGVPGLIILRSGRDSATLEFKGGRQKLTPPAAALARQSAPKDQ